MWFFSRSASRSLSTSFWSFCTDLSANSARASACKRRIINCRIMRDVTLCIPLTFSSLTSRDFRLLPTTRSSSSSSTILLQRRGTLSSARSRSASRSAMRRAIFFPHALPFSAALAYSQQTQTRPKDHTLAKRSDHLRLTGLCTLLSTLEIGLNHGQLAGHLWCAAKPPSPRHLIVFPVGILSHGASLLQLTLKSVHPLLVRDAPVLQHFAHAAREDTQTPGNVESTVACLFQFLGGNLESFLRAFQVLFEQLDAPVVSSHLRLGLRHGLPCTHSLQSLVLLFQLVVGLGQLLLHLVQFILDGLDLLLQAADLLLGLRHVLYLLGAEGGIPGLLFRGLCSVDRIILLQLHRLHLLLDGLHLGCFRGVAASEHETKLDHALGTPWDD
ncbi:unnamed protein product [Ixodes hexagonus]